MSWYIDPQGNNGYPFNDYFPTSFQTDYTGELPYSSWRIEEGQNNGYPFTGMIPSDFQTDFYADRDTQLPYSSWRIQSGVNNGYPYQNWIEWRDYTGASGEDDSRGGGDMHIGGSRSNYPNGFSIANRGGVMKQFDKKNMINVHGRGSDTAMNAISAGLSGRQFCVSGSQLAYILNYMNTNLTELDMTKIQKLYGANIYDGILVCKAFPFQLAASAGTYGINIFGSIAISDNQYKHATTNLIRFYMGSVEIDIKQAWELENIDYCIYLPFAGIFPLDVRNGLAIDVDCYIDLYHGTGEYHVHQDSQLMSIYTFKIGADVPINLDQGIAHSNMMSNITSSITKGLPVAMGAIGMAAAGPAGAAVGGMIGSMAQQSIDQNYVSHMQTQAPQMGGLTSMYSYPFARVIAMAPYMFNDGEGFQELLGENRSKCFETLRTCKGGFIKTVNYKCDIIVATDEEKQEIERLMNGGVFL